MLRKMIGNPPGKRHSVALEKAHKGFVEASHVPALVGGPAADVLLAHSGAPSQGQALVSIVNYPSFAGLPQDRYAHRHPKLIGTHI
jgi:hypothetical protein